MQKPEKKDYYYHSSATRLSFRTVEIVQRKPRLMIDQWILASSLARLSLFSNKARISFFNSSGERCSARGPLWSAHRSAISPMEASNTKIISLNRIHDATYLNGTGSAAAPFTCNKKKSENVRNWSNVLWIELKLIKNPSSSPEWWWNVFVQTYGKNFSGLRLDPPEMFAQFRRIGRVNVLHGDDPVSGITENVVDNESDGLLEYDRREDFSPRRG